jgi:hypothetical protein
VSAFPLGSAFDRRRPTCIRSCVRVCARARACVTPLPPLSALHQQVLSKGEGDLSFHRHRQVHWLTPSAFAGGPDALIRLENAQADWQAVLARLKQNRNDSDGGGGDGGGDHDDEQGRKMDKKTAASAVLWVSSNHLEHANSKKKNFTGSHNNNGTERREVVDACEEWTPDPWNSKQVRPVENIV